MLNYTNNNNGNLGGNQLKFFDLLNIASFCIGLMNLQENMTQGDKQDMMQQLDTKTNTILKEIHEHLQSQDDKIDLIMNKLEVANNDS